MKIKYTNLEIFTLLLNSFLATENLQNFISFPKL
jgi:hypothetical protein